MTTAVDNQITAGERRELRSVVRSQMKALRAEIKQRERELDAEIEVRLVEKYRDQDARSRELQAKIRKLTAKANEQLHKLLEEFDDLSDGGVFRRVNDFNSPYISRNEMKRDELRRALQAGMKAEISKAVISIDRQEADLLRDLAVDGLKSDAAKTFLARITTAQELLPPKRIVEIESRYETTT